MVAAGFERAPVAELFEAPVAVVYFDEGGDGRGQFGTVAVGPTVDDLLLEGAVEPLYHAVGLGFADEGEAGREPMVAALALEVVGQVLAAVVVAEFDAAGGIGGGAAEDAKDGLGDRLCANYQISYII